MFKHAHVLFMGARLVIAHVFSQASPKAMKAMKAMKAKAKAKASASKANAHRYAHV